MHLHKQRHSHFAILESGSDGAGNTVATLTESSCLRQKKMADENVVPGASPGLVTRAEAKARGLKHFFDGNPCSKGHTAQRYVNSGLCKVCRNDSSARAKTRKAAGLPPLRTYARSEAKARGELKYSTGEPCSYGHHALRWVSTGYCTECNDLHKHLWRTTKKERWLQTERDWRKRNHDKVTTQARARYAANPDLYRQKSREWGRARPEQMRAKAKAYALANKERVRTAMAAYQARAREERALKRHLQRAANLPAARAKEKALRDRNPGAALAQRHKRRAWKLKATQGDLKSIVSFLRWLKTASRVKCYWCRKAVTRTQRHADHIIPLAKGGAHSAANLCAACATCNKRKSAHMPEMFAGQAELSFAA